MKSLKEIYNNNKTSKVGWGDKGNVHSYIDHYYSSAFESYRKSAKYVLEIGVKGGHSLNMWKQYFENAHIIGVDNQVRNTICPTCEVIIGDATLKETFTNVPKLDIIIDDGSHMIEHQLKSFEILWDKLKPGGLYVIEDVADLDNTRGQLMDLHESAEVFDFRNKLNRYDDVIVQYRKPE